MKKSFLVVLMCVLVFSCSSNDDGGSASGPSGSITAVNIPGIGSQNGGFGIDLKTTNAGLYFRVYKPNQDHVWIYRLPSGSPSSNWMMYDFPDIQTWHPYNTTNEGPDTFGIFYSSVTKNGFFSVNTNSPDPTMHNNPLSMFSASNASGFLIDNSERGYKWLFDGNTVLVKQNNNSNQYDIIATLPESISIQNVVASPDDAVVWIGGNEKCFRVTINGNVTAYDVSSFIDGGNFVNFVDKIRFSEDEVFFKCYDKVFRVNGSSVELFYEMKSILGFMGGDFAVDNKYMYATDGYKKDIDLGMETRFVPEPDFTDFENAMNYSAFSTGQIETSNNPTDRYVYVLTPDKLLFVAK